MVQGSPRKQVRDVSAKFQCELARNGEVKKMKFYSPKILGVGVGCYVSQTAEGESTTEYRVKNS